MLKHFLNTVQRSWITDTDSTTTISYHQKINRYIIEHSFGLKLGNIPVIMLFVRACTVLQKCTDDTLIENFKKSLFMIMLLEMQDQRSNYQIK